jgi:hypothetical protein
MEALRVAAELIKLQASLPQNVGEDRFSGKANRVARSMQSRGKCDQWLDVASCSNCDDGNFHKVSLVGKMKNASIPMMADHHREHISAVSNE